MALFFIYAGFSIFTTHMTVLIKCISKNGGDKVEINAEKYAYFSYRTNINRCYTLHRKKTAGQNLNSY